MLLTGLVESGLHGGPRPLLVYLKKPMKSKRLFSAGILRGFIFAAMVEPPGKMTCSLSPADTGVSISVSTSVIV